MDIASNLTLLVDRFEAIKEKSLNDHQLFNDFIQPLFQFLGWNLKDSKNEFHINPVTKKLKKNKPEHPDYSFYSIHSKEFYLKIFHSGHNDTSKNDLVKSLHRYCWTSNVSLCVITDFNSFSIYNFNSKPGTKFKSIFECNFFEYALHWKKIEKLISRQAVNNGSLKKYQKETIQSSHYYLAKKLLSWHDNLYENISLKNSGLSELEIDLTILRIINRIVFLRFCENLGIEPFQQLKNIASNTSIFTALVNIFKNANERYNSGLFYFEKESGRNTKSLDNICFTLDIDDNLLVGLLQFLYSTDQPIDFDSIPVDTLALVYHIYIHHIINKSDPKPDGNEYVKLHSVLNKKIVAEQVIHRTFSEFLEGKKAGKRSSVSSIKILDPCCATGLYLHYSYDYLVNWHLEQYLIFQQENESVNEDFPVKRTKDDIWQLSWQEKERILKNNIFGLDINRLAVESCQLLLSLKLLQDINIESIKDQLKLFWQHALPDLNDNIKCGNALIETDIYQLQQFVGLNEEQKIKINAFDWQKEFNEFNPQESFDIIVGNPPSHFSEFLIQKTKPYFKQRYEHFKDFKNSYLLFYEKSLKLLKNYGIIGFAVASDWISNFESFFILEDYWIKEITKLVEKPSKGAGQIITIIKKKESGETITNVINTVNLSNPIKRHHFKTINYLNLNFFFGHFEQFLDSDLHKKIVDISDPLENFANCCSGYNAYESGRGEDPEGNVQTKETMKNRPYHSDKKLNEHWKIEIIGRDISRYCLKFSTMRWIKYGPWLAAPRDPEIFLGTRILMHDTISINNGRIESSICTDEVYHGRDIISIKPGVAFPNIYYLLGILNSKLFNWYYLVTYSKSSSEAFPKIFISNLNNAPIKNIDEYHIQEKNRYNELTSLVKRILELYQKRLETSAERDILTLDKLIYNIDSEIDLVVYKLYDFSKAEIDIIENSFNNTNGRSLTL